MPFFISIMKNAIQKSCFYFGIFAKCSFISISPLYRQYVVLLFSYICIILQKVRFLEKVLIKSVGKNYYPSYSIDKSPTTKNKPLIFTIIKSAYDQYHPSIPTEYTSDPLSTLKYPQKSFSALLS